MSIRLLAGVALTLSLVGCGGGGGGGGSTTGGTGGNGTTSLVPAAPTSGATLVADASTLRPLRDGSPWQYHGTVLAASGAISSYYVASVSQQASAGAFKETGDNVLGSGTTETVTVSLAAGVINTQAVDPLGIGGTQVANYIELRSPLRANDQYTQFEQAGAQLGGDIDGDGKADVADVAIYARVVGNEDVVLRELSRTVAAVRVDTIGLVRPIRSSDGVAMPVVNVLQSTWYAPGLGIVRRTQTAASTSGTGPIDHDEKLFSWDGVTEGIGAQGPTPAKISFAIAPTLTLLPSPLAGAAVGSQALVMADTLHSSDPTSLTVGIFDSHGRLQDVREYSGLLTAPSNSTVGLHGIDANSALLVMPTASSTFGLADVRLQRFDASGGLVGTSTTLTLGAETDILSGWDGNFLWLFWRSNGQLILRPFGIDGVPAAPAQTIDAPPVGQLVDSQRLAAANGQALLSWTHEAAGTTSYRYALVRGPSAVADTRTLGSTLPGISVSSASVVTPVLASGIVALEWPGPIFSFAGPGPLPDALPRAVTLDPTTLNPVRGSSGTIDNELLPSSWSDTSQPFLVGAVGDRFIAASFVRQRVIPEQFGPKDYALASFAQPGAAPIATAAAGSTAVALANESGTLVNIDEFGRPRLLVTFSDRVLVVGDDSNRTMTSLFWLR
jgi:hypothetical protein